ncbi:MAG: hypothetical protein OEV78_02190 [Spirochaetia bacterium]|nr:hypothetical protein [Spirochaetia bacterium]
MLKKELRFRPVILLLIVLAVPNIIFFLVKAMSHYYVSDDFLNSALILKREGIKVVFNIAELEKFNQKDNLKNIEDELTQILKRSKSGEFQSKSCNETECIYTLYGTEADRMHQLIKPVLRKYPEKSGYIYKIYDLKNYKDQVKGDLY